MRRVAVIASLTILTFAVGMILLEAATRGFERFPALSSHWVTTWSGATQPFVVQHVSGSAAPPPEFRDAYNKGILHDQTIRMIVQSTLSGSRIRIRLTNQYSKQPLTIGAARVVKIVAREPRWESPFLTPVMMKPNQGTDQQVLFEGKASVVIPPGGVTRSDPIDLETGDRGFMQVSLYLPNRTEPATWVSGKTFATVVLGNTTVPGSEGPNVRRSPLRGAYWLAGVEVYAGSNTKAVLIIDDDNWHRGARHNRGWQAPFTSRLLANGGSDRFAVLDSTMANCWYGYCPVSILERIEDAQRNRRGVKWVILSAGSYDIGVSPTLGAEDLIRSQKTVVDVVHAAGLKIYGVTYPPFGRNYGYTEEMETLRVAVNTWIRESGAFDGVADFDRALRDGADPAQPLWFYSRGGGLSDHAFVAMVNSFDLSVF